VLFQCDDWRARKEELKKNPIFLRAGERRTYQLTNFPTRTIKASEKTTRGKPKKGRKVRGFNGENHVLNPQYQRSEKSRRCSRKGMQGRAGKAYLQLGVLQNYRRQPADKRARTNPGKE